MTIKANYPIIRPSLNLDFANSRVLDPRITFTRASTAWYTDKDGLLKVAAAKTPRFDFDPITLACNGLLIEEARTNLLTYSESFDNAAWTKVSATIVQNATAAPDGTLTADKGVENTANSSHIPIRRMFTSSAATTYTFSVFVKSAERSAFTLLAMSGNGSAIYSADFDLVGLTTVTRSNTMPGKSSLEDVGNGWHRCVITYTDVAGGASAYVDLRLSDNAAVSATIGDTYTGDGVSGIYLWGAQLEVGNFPTSYIPTTSAAATRAADVAQMTEVNFSSWYRQDEGTFVIDFVTGRKTVSAEIVYISDEASSNVIQMARFSSGGLLQYSGSVGGVNQWSLAPSGYNITGSRHKTAAAYKANDVAQAVDGVLKGADSSASIPVVTRMDIGMTYNGSNNLCGHIAKMSYYPKRLSNAELQALSA